MKNDQKWLHYFHLLALDEIDSTNNEAKRLCLKSQNPSNYVICANKQTAGRGRYGKQWESNDGNLYLSIIIPKTGDLEKMTQLSFVASLAIEEAISILTKKYYIESDVKLKWPNDVLLNGKKVSGILLETGGASNEFVIVGIGLNINSFPVIVDKPATSLHQEGFYFVEATQLLNKIMNSFFKFYQTWLSKDFLEIRDEWLSKTAFKGKIITINTGHSSITGKYIDIALDGAIRLQIASDQIISITTGEIFFNV